MEKDLSLERAIKKVEIAIDKMLDLQDAGYGCDRITRLLEMLNQHANDMRRGDVHS